MVSNNVSAEESSKLRDYELVVVISPEVTEENLEATIANTSQFITNRGGTITEVAQWGKRKLAYPIKHFGEGSYVLTKFQMDPAFGKELEANLLLAEDILRHLLIKVES